MNTKRFIQTTLLTGCFLSAFAALSCAGPLVFIGTRGTWDHGVQDGIKEGLPENAPAYGIFSARLNEETGELKPYGIQAVLEAASWLEVNPDKPVLYAVASGIRGRKAETNIISYNIDKDFGKLYLLNTQLSGGLDGTHMDIDKEGKTLFVANYADGNVATLPILEDGSLGPVVCKVKDFGGKRSGSHGVALDPSGKYLLDAAAWTYRIFEYKYDSASRRLTPAEPPFYENGGKIDARHFEFSPDGRYVYTLAGFSCDVMVHTFAPQTGHLEKIQQLNLYPEKWEGQKSLAEIDLSKDGKFLYVSMREGQNKLVVFSVNQDDGKLTEIQRISSNGDNPWAFRIDPSGKWMLVTNMDSNTVNVFSVNAETGKLAPTDYSISVPKPQVAVFY